MKATSVKRLSVLVTLANREARTKWLAVNAPQLTSIGVTRELDAVDALYKGDFTSLTDCESGAHGAAGIANAALVRTALASNVTATVKVAKEKAKTTRTNKPAQEAASVAVDPRDVKIAALEQEIARLTAILATVKTAVA